MKILQKNSCEISFFSILHENGLLTRQSEVISAEHQDRSDGGDHKEESTSFVSCRAVRSASNTFSMVSRGVFL